MVEADRDTYRGLEAAREALGAAQVELVAGDAFDYLRRTDVRFDLVFVDPPFRQNAVPEVLARLPPRLAPAARVYIESARGVEPPAAWSELRAGRAGQVRYQLLQWRGDDQGGLRGNI
jgi:16S rRNA G966 N2-methylase RsmD